MNTFRLLVSWKEAKSMALLTIIIKHGNIVCIDDWTAEWVIIASNEVCTW